MVQKLKKISQLPSAVNVYGNDYWIVDQNNVSKKATVDQLLRKLGDVAGSIELQKGATHLQWRHVGDTEWRDLISIEELSGAIRGAAWSGEFTYSKGDIVSIDDESSYISQQDNNINHSVASDDGTWWKLVKADALFLQGREISSDAPEDKEALIWDATLEMYVPGAVAPSINEDSVDVRINNGNIQWQFNGGSWYNLISLAELRSQAAPEMSFFSGNKVALEFGPVPGLNSINPNKCLVVVGGVTQQPTVSYTLSLADGGKLIFSEAPPNVPISIQPY